MDSDEIYDMMCMIRATAAVYLFKANTETSIVILYNIYFIQWYKETQKKSTLACLLLTALLVKYQTLRLTWDKEHCSLQVRPNGAGTQYT